MLFGFILANGFICVGRPYGDAVGLSKSRTDALLAYDIASIIIQCMDLIEQIPALTMVLHVFENFLPQNIVMTLQILKGENSSFKMAFCFRHSLTCHCNRK